MPSPPGAVAVARAREGRQSKTARKRHPLSPQSDRVVQRRDGGVADHLTSAGVARARPVKDGPRGRRHLALAMRRKAHRFEGRPDHARLAARARARCPRPQGAVAVARAREGRQSQTARKRHLLSPRSDRVLQRRDGGVADHLTSAGVESSATSSNAPSCWPTAPKSTNATSRTAAARNHRKSHKPRPLP